MTDKILVVTSPDDVLDDGIRITIVGLTPDQTQLISTVLTTLSFGTFIIYSWKIEDDTQWLLDKKHKSDIIIFNADYEPNGAVELITGYMAAQPNSYYFGILKNLGSANKRAIYSINDLENIFTSLINKI